MRPEKWQGSLWETPAMIAGGAVFGALLLFVILLVTESSLVFHPGLGIAAALLELVDFFFVLLGKRMGLSRPLRIFLLVSLFAGMLILLAVLGVFLLLLSAA